MADMQNTKVTLYWLEKSRAQRILWLLEECHGIDYDIKVYKRGSDRLADPELKKIHPLGKSPVIGLEAPGATKPLILAESAFMTEYLAERFAKQLVPARYAGGNEGIGAETESWLRYRFFMHYAEGSLMSVLLAYTIVSTLRDGNEIPFFIKPITRAIVGKMEQLFFNAQFKTHFGFLEEQLSTSPNGGQYLCGAELTAADILMSFPLLAARKGSVGLTKSAYPKLDAYMDLLEKNEGYQRSIKVAEEKTGEKYAMF